MEKFDVNFVDENGNEKNKVVKNRINSISRFLEDIPSGSILCAENTGVYGDLLLYLSNQLDILICFVPGYTIKHSLGMLKGKSDQMDARRIREYGERFQDKLVPARYEDETIKELEELYTLRSQLVKAKKALTTSETGRKHQVMRSIYAHDRFISVVNNLNSEILAIESEIEKIIYENEEMRENYELATGVIGVGPVITTELLIKTGNFKTINTSRKASSYAGICPFPNSTGKMVGKAKTSPFADKKLKALLFMGAKAAVRFNKEYRLYYQKKQLEGKPHYLIMNNISNKMLRTIYSVVQNKTPYIEGYICLDPREKKINSSTKKVA